MDKENGLLNGKISFKALPDGSLDKNKVPYICCRCELSYHWHKLSLRYHSLTEHTADAESPPPSSKTDHGEQFETETPGQLYMRQTFNSDN